MSEHYCEEYGNHIECGCEPCCFPGLGLCEKQESELRLRVRELEKAIKDFLTGYDKAAPSVEGVYTMAFVHGYKYVGYQYTEELKALRDAINE